MEEVLEKAVDSLKEEITRILGFEPDPDHLALALLAPWNMDEIAKHVQFIATGETEEHKQKIGTLEAARILGCTQNWVRKKCISGELPAEKVGRDWLINPKDLEPFKKPGGRRPRKGT